MLVLCFCLYNRLSSSDMYAIYSYAKCTFCGCSSSPTLSLPLLLVVCTLSIQPNDSLSKYISRASPARGDTFVSISFHRLICYKITFSCLINFYALKHTHSYTHSLSLTHTQTATASFHLCWYCFLYSGNIFSLFLDMRNMRAWRNFPIDFHGLLHTFSTIFFDFLCVFFLFVM